jgi:hypothetical protein
MEKRAVVALNGFLGDRLGFDVTDEVNPRAKSAGLGYYRRRSGRPGRGGAGPIEKRRLYRWCQARICEGKELIMVGKSYGGHWVLDVIEDLHIGHRVDALVFDPTSVLHRRESHIRSIAAPEGVTVIRQLGRRSGYQVAGANDTIIEAKHSDIERTKQGRCMLDAWLKQRDL